MLELLSPAGNLQKLEYALAYGADAVYVGASGFSLRRAADNLNLKEIKKATSVVRNCGKKLYVAVNVFAHQSDLKQLEVFLEGLATIKPDALIVADPGIFRMATRICSNIPLHVSTQANVTNLEAARFWVELGASRITLARELTLPEIRYITKKVSVETEVFVHGAMCLSYSGRCWLSHYLSKRDANQGDCAQSCRWNYVLVEEKRPGQSLPVFEDSRSSYILSSKDLCLAKKTPELIDAGISSFKIEGRMKSIHYVATVTKTYRQIINAVLKDKDKFIFEQRWLEELEKISHRQYTDGFIDGNGQNLQIEGTKSYLKTADFVAEVKEETAEGCIVLVKNRLLAGDELEVLRPDGDNKSIQACFYDEQGQLLSEAHANTVVWFKEKWSPKSLIRRKVTADAQMVNT